MLDVLCGSFNELQTWKGVIATPTPEPVDVPSLEDVVLSASEQNDLEHHYQNIGTRPASCIFCKVFIMRRVSDPCLTFFVGRSMSCKRGP
jgi:hypothetical protein